MKAGVKSQDNLLDHKMHSPTNYMTLHSPEHSNVNQFSICLKGPKMYIAYDALVPPSTGAIWLLILIQS
jgi:hypothetical protein